MRAFSKTPKKAMLFSLVFPGILTLFIFAFLLPRPFCQDPQRIFVYHYTPCESTPSSESHILCQSGFSHDGTYRLNPGSKARVLFQFKRSPAQGVLLRLWAYSDGGKYRLNSLQLSTDNGATFNVIARNTNFTGKPIVLTPYLNRKTSFQILITAENQAPFSYKSFDQLDLVVFADEQTQPILPPIPVIVAVFFLLHFVFELLIQKRFGKQQLQKLLLLVVLLLALSLRWNHLREVSGFPLFSDAHDYYVLSQNMKPFTSSGFFSASSGKREPLFLLVGKGSLELFGTSQTSMRLTSLFFSVVMIYLTFFLGKYWFSSFAGLCSALILSINPYLVSLSSRGLRAEFFSCLFLIFLLILLTKKHPLPWKQSAWAGVTGGLLLLTRMETLAFLLLVILGLPLLYKKKYSLKKALCSIVITLTMIVPYEYNLYKRHGDFFYTSSQNAVFFANQEFGTNWQRGAFQSGRLSAFDYLFRLHDFRQVLTRSVMGLGKIILSLPMDFLSGKGNRDLVSHELHAIKNNTSLAQIINGVKVFLSLFIRDTAGNLFGLILLAGIPAGIVAIAFSPFRILLYFLFSAHIVTAFLFYTGLDKRIIVHSYPLFCFCFCFMLSLLGKRLILRTR